MIRRLACWLPAVLLAWALPASAAPLPPQIHTVAGGGSCSGLMTSGGPCDNVSATSVPIGQARWVAAVPGGGYLYVDEVNHLVRQVLTSGKVITVAGNGTNVDAPDGTLAVNSGLNDPVSVAPLAGGGFLVTEFDGSVVREVSPGTPATATITTIAGTGTPGDNGPTGSGSAPATSTQLNYPTDAEPLPDGSVLIADTYNNMIREVSPSGTITNAAGGGPCNDINGTSCDGLPAAGVALHLPDSISPIQAGAGGYLVAESGANAVRMISPTGAFSTVAGTPSTVGAYGGDNGPATSAQLNDPEQVVSMSGGGFLVADTHNQIVREVSSAGTISTVAGTPGLPSDAGDGGDATAAVLDNPASISPLASGGFLIADEDNGAIRQVTIAPTTRVVLSPATPDGRNGWYDTALIATTSVVGGKSTQCVLDPGVVPTVYDEIPPGCPYTGAGSELFADGVHTLYAASVNSFGDKEIPVGVTIKVDLTAPTLRCAGTPTFRVGQRHAAVEATVSDSLSGPASPVVSAAVRTSARPGRHRASLTGFDNAGNPAFITCSYTLTAPVLKPMPALSQAFSAGARSSSVRRLVVTDVPPGAAVNVSCLGGGCPFSLVRNVTGQVCNGRPCSAGGGQHQSRPRTVTLTALFANISFGPGVQVTVSVTKHGRLGRDWVLRTLAGQPPSETVGCLQPGSVTRSAQCAAPAR